MTATVTEAIPDVDLDLEPPCEVKVPCDRPATWLFRFRHVCECGQEQFLVCHPHALVVLTQNLRSLLGPAAWTCGHCGTETELIESRPL